MNWTLSPVDSFERKSECRVGERGDSLEGNTGCGVNIGYGVNMWTLFMFV